MKRSNFTVMCLGTEIYARFAKNVCRDDVVNVCMAVTHHRRSQEGGERGNSPPKFLENIVIFCFERRFPRQNSVIGLKSNILASPNF